MRCDIGDGARRAPVREANLNHDRIGRSSCQSLDRVTFPLVSMRVACDYDELTTIQVERGVETALGEKSDLGIWHRRLEPLAWQLRQTTSGHAHRRLELDDEGRTLKPNVTVELQCTLRCDPACTPIDSGRFVSL